MDVLPFPLVEAGDSVFSEQFLDVDDVGDHRGVVVVVVEAPVLAAFVVVGEDPLESVEVAS